MTIHDHVCFICSSIEEKNKMMETQVRAGIINSELGLCLVEETRKEEVFNCLKFVVYI
ncbi:hypothetical protein HGI51_12815 [Clostridium saccharobutylicum]|uniref:hypothetical protein n=1 Tax=Clostridium saccharobutylicum TaxID=169679 RepID=UPI0016249017|nr:hypothetical protein [Clostridium saccharobutylicum]MBC2445521.1 hypothetical protein [Clostridium saccharobutylicum]NOV84864.1 hypothetical protein [Clostridium saccharobutylicum]NSB90723.1 hypothetical protein [Clostridium saccharobutylicum]NYC45561.1 hypothetical protein [Clostridium saccharobutylicum]NYD03744.1 hypothetical protein [Clostridium saccharobutylicum]